MILFGKSWTSTFQNIKKNEIHKKFISKNEKIWNISENFRYFEKSEILKISKNFENFENFRNFENFQNFDFRIFRFWKSGCRKFSKYFFRNFLTFWKIKIFWWIFLKSSLEFQHKLENQYYFVRKASERPSRPKFMWDATRRNSIWYVLGWLDF